MAHVTLISQKRYSLAIVVISCIISSILSSVLLHFHELARRRNLLGMTYMSHSLVLLSILNDSSNGESISSDNLEKMESIAFCDALFGMLQGKQFQESPWLDFLGEMDEYVRKKRHKSDTPVILELDNMLRSVLSKSNQTLEENICH